MFNNSDDDDDDDNDESNMIHSTVLWNTLMSNVSRGNCAFQYFPPFSLDYLNKKIIKI